jgi:hypothetical protein
MLTKVDWTKYGVFNGIARDPRCENCMTHCGYEPTPSLGIDTQPGDTWKLIRYNFGARPQPKTNASHVDAYNGVTTGKGHLSGKDAKKTSTENGQCAAGDAELVGDAQPVGK